MRSSQRPSVLICIESWGTGGIESYVMGIIRSLHATGIRFSVFAIWSLGSPHNKELEAYGVKLHVVFDGSKPNQLKRLKTGLEAFEAYVGKERPDVVHICAMNGGGFEYAKVSEKEGVPIRIVHAHNSDVGEGAKALKKLANRVLCWHARGHETVRLACSTDAGRFLFGRSKFEIIRNGIDVDKFSYSQIKRRRLRDHFGLGEQELLVGNPSRLAPAKNPLFQLRVFSELLKLKPTSYFLLQEKGELINEVKQLARELDIEDQVVWLKPTNDISSVYSALDAVLFPSIFEGLPFVLVEAQAAGLPILCSDRVTDDVSITDLVHTESLDAPVGEWADRLISIISNMNDRSLSANLVKERGYDLLDSTNAIKEIYLQFNQ